MKAHCRNAVKTGRIMSENEYFGNVMVGGQATLA